MTTAQLRLRQWFNAIPLLSIAAIQVGWHERVLCLISREAAVAKAKRIAREIGQVDNLRIVYYKQHIGFVRLVVETGVWNRSSWCVDLQHSIHFRGRFESVPRLEKAGSISFETLPEAIFGANPTRFSSYLTILKVD